MNDNFVPEVCKECQRNSFGDSYLAKCPTCRKVYETNRRCPNCGERMMATSFKIVGLERVPKGYICPNCDYQETCWYE